MKFKSLYEPLKNELQQIEEALKDSIDAEHPIFRKSSLQLIEAGGKRIRPVFVLLSSQFGKENRSQKAIKSVAVALELIHMATLVHDDVVDDATLRRGHPTIKHTYDNRIAMYTGDYILARALEVVTTIEDAELHQVLSKTLVKVVEGEFDQLRDQYNLQQNLRTYLQRIKRKTALLIATSCKLGAIAAGAKREHVRHLYQYGYYVGMSFQIIDDILDITASPEQLGKPTGSDLLQGNITLPVLCAMEDKHFKKQLQALFQHPEKISQQDIDEILSLLVETDAIERSYRLSNLYLEKANTALNKLPQKDAKTALQIIANMIGKRKF